MTVYELIRTLEKYDPNKIIGIIHYDNWGRHFDSSLEINEIAIDSNNELDAKNGTYPFTKVLHIC